MSNEYYGAASTPMDDYLAHYGVRGMKWGVRRYFDKNGNLTPHAYKKYGNSPKKNPSARKMTKDYNELDRMYADTRADVIDVKRGKEFPYIIDRSRMGMQNMPKEQKLKILSGQLKGIKGLQDAIIEKAKEQNYTIKRTPKRRYGTSVFDIRDLQLGNIATAMEHDIHPDTEKNYNGTKVKIRKTKYRRG